MIKKIKQNKTYSSNEKISKPSQCYNKVISIKKYETRKLAKYSKSLIKETDRRLQD